MALGSSKEDTLRIAIIGGGFTGVAYAIHLIRHTNRKLDIVIVEPNATLARGVAYGTDHPLHRINVPSDRMSLFPQDPGHATRWMFAHGVLPDAASTDERGRHYVARASYGAYVLDTLQQTVAAHAARVQLRHVRGEVRAIDTNEDGTHAARLADATTLPADIVALAFGHAAPGLPCRVSDTALSHPGFIANPWQDGALQRLAADASVLLVGTGLTMDDIVTTLLAGGHRGPITALSRRGLLAQPHGIFTDNLDFLEGSPPPRTARAIVRVLRQRIERDADQGWHPAMDAFRSQLHVIWPALPASEQQRVVRRLLPFWEVHRFRAAPQVLAVVNQAIASGRLQLLRAGIAAIDSDGASLLATLRVRGAAVRVEKMDAVVLCNGPDKNIVANPLVGALLASGKARLDNIGAGLAVDAQSRLLDATGAAVPGLYAFGPLTRGSFGEMTGAPDITKHIEKLLPSR